MSQRCGQPQASAHRLVLRRPGGDRLTAAEVGRGRVGAVFVHETGYAGLCGFWPYAVWLQREYGVHSVLVDLCNYGESVCHRASFSSDYVAQAELAVRWLRGHGGHRVTIVGASLGGAVAAVASAEIRPRVDGVVDLSGPLQWPGLDVRGAAARIRSDALFAVASDDVDVPAKQLRAALEATSTAQREFVLAPNGHGWEMLGEQHDDRYRPTALARAVAH